MAEFPDIQQQKKFKVLLIGDSCVDIYQYGTVDRISPEAPVPVFRFISEDQKKGMAGNVEHNLSTLGCDVKFYHGALSTKTRLIDSRSRQHIVRIDNDIISTALEFESIDIKDLVSADAIVISDYNKGYVDYELIETLRSKTDLPIFVDTKKIYLDKLEGCIVKINSHEYDLVKTVCSDLIVTKGKSGALYKNQLYPTDNVEVSDVTGAGDTFLSALVYRYLHTGSIEESIKFANRLAAITIQYTGVYAPTLEEIQ
jgi:D-beta-D-heptose 7-phosphate kinase/D-beta-D-heptose 1-phosphate adenosyltransferase